MYRALYRKWRPQRFEDVVGQRAIVTALKNQITAGRVGHAYLFTGVRGTGKTTCAKIFAKAVNCLHPVNGDPCGQCEICKGIDNGSLLDVVEMDAASNNGVDDIRDLRDETAYTPSACQYKVYIIDEVHMLSTAAFNALLKTLEEPPAHVIFILATTEIQKVPATILSRCQRYDFTRIGPEDIARRVEYIAGEEKLELSPKAPLKSLSKGNKEINALHCVPCETFDNNSIKLLSSVGACPFNVFDDDGFYPCFLTCKGGEIREISEE